MSPLRHAMFSGYNKFDDTKVRIGSWREEQALKELTGVTRLANPKNKKVFNQTGIRVLFHTERAPSPDVGKSTSQVSFGHPQSVAATKDRAAHRQPGPRAVRAKQKQLAIVEAEEAERRTVEADEKRLGDFDTTTRQSFVRYSNEDAKAARPNRVNKKVMASVCDIRHEQKRDGIGNGYDYTTGPTITLWNVGGLAPKRAEDCGSFGRTARFTEPLYRQWLPDFIPGLIDQALDPTLRAQEASALTFLKRRVLEAGAGKELLPLGLIPEIRKCPRVIEGMAAFEVPLTECELYAVVTAFDANPTGQIYLDKFIDFIRSEGLAGSRMQWVRDAFKRLNLMRRGNGRIPLDMIRTACDLSASKAMSASKCGIVTKEREGVEVVELFRHFSPHSNRVHENDFTVGIEEFTEAFRDIGAALPASGHHGQSPQHCDADGAPNGDDVFRIILSNITRENKSH